MLRDRDAIANLAVRDIERARTFYDMPGMTRQGDLHIGGRLKVAWFKDPDGNILNLASG